jgi:hypothetical protein
MDDEPRAKPAQDCRVLQLIRNGSDGRAVREEKDTAKSLKRVPGFSPVEN